MDQFTLESIPVASLCVRPLWATVNINLLGAMVVSIRLAPAAAAIAYSYRRVANPLPLRVAALLLARVYALLVSSRLTTSKANTFLPAVLSLATLIVASNLVGIFPYIVSATTYLSVVITLSATLFIGIVIRAICVARPNAVVLFVPVGVP